MTKLLHHRPDHRFDMVQTRVGKAPKSGPYAIMTPKLTRRERLTYASLPFVLARYAVVGDRVVGRWTGRKWEEVPMAHRHKCSKCGHRWAHVLSSASERDIESMHTCTMCGAGPQWATNN